MDHHIIEGLRNNDRMIIKSLYRDAFGYCTSFIMENQGDINLARDYFQEAIMVLFRNAMKPEFELTCSVKTYLYSVIRNQWLKKINKQNRGGLKLVIDENPNREYILIDEDFVQEKKQLEEKHQLVGNAIKLISKDCYQLIMDFYFRKMDLSKIAEKMGYTYQFVKVKKNRCMDSLKKKVREL